jgi:hypothetical protein
VIALKEPRPPASAADLETAEERLAELGLRILPSDKAFLAEQDGGKPVRNAFSFQQHGREQNDLVRLFYGIAPSPNGALVEEAETARDQLPAGLLPIASDNFGNLILLDTRDDGDGPVSSGITSSRATRPTKTICSGSRPTFRRSSPS